MDSVHAVIILSGWQHPSSSELLDSRNTVEQMRELT